jgi:hypothetical protein
LFWGLASPLGAATNAEGVARAKTGASSAATELVPRINPEGGVFTGRLSVQMQSPVKDGVIRYTLDGTEPTTSSPLYGEPFTVGRTALVRARIFRGSNPAGPAVTRAFSQASAEVGRFTGNLPLVVINTFGQEVQHETRRIASVCFIDAQAGRASLSGGSGPVVEFRGEVWWRGKSSLRYLKRSFGIKTRDDAGKSQAVSLLGLPADSDWVLYAPYPDKTLLRDVLAYDLSNQMGHYASRTRFVEVFLNEGLGRLTMQNYLGVYVLEEKIKRAPDRVKLQKLGTNDVTEPAITGGYLFKKDHNVMMGEVEPSEDGRPNFGGGGNSGSRYGYPTGPGGFPADPRGFLPTVGGERAVTRNRGMTMRPPMAPGERFEPGIVFQDGGRVLIERREGRGGEIRRNFTPGRGWSAGPAVEETFVTDSGNEFYYVEPKEDEINAHQRRWLRNHLNEFERVLAGADFADPKRGYAAYIDADSFIDYHLLVEVTKNIDGFRFSTYFQKDRGGRIKAQPVWDWNLSFGNANGKQGWLPEHWYWPQLDDQQYSYYRRLFEDPEFAQRYVDRWGQLRASVFSDSNVLARIDAHVATVGEARQRNFARWPILGRMVWPNHFVGQSYDDELRFMKDWIRRRLSWIDAQFTAAPRVSGGKSRGREVTLTAARGEIYYTTDGTDPRGPGGKPSTRASTPAGSIELKPGAHLSARAVYEGRWSPPLRLP